MKFRFYLVVIIFISSFVSVAKASNCTRAEKNQFIQKIPIYTGEVTRVVHKLIAVMIEAKN